MKRILIVDDDPDVLENVAMILESGYAVALARNGVDALRRLSSEHFDAMLLDLGMPQKDGASVLREMEARKMRVPVLLVSASHGLAAKARALTSPSSFATFASRPSAVNGFVR
ncbi:response regulator [bacterium]|nr:MAG: response regulator [bacterium]